MSEVSSATCSCIICAKTIARPSPPKKATFKDQLVVIFFMKKLFKYSLIVTPEQSQDDEESILESLIEKRGNPENWISFCPPCFQRVKKAQSAYTLYTKVEWTLNSLRDSIQRKVLDTFPSSATTAHSSSRSKNLCKRVRGAIYSHRNTTFDAEEEEEDEDDSDFECFLLDNVPDHEEVERLKNGGKGATSTAQEKRKGERAPVSAAHPPNNKALLNSTKEEEAAQVAEEFRTCTICFEVFDEPQLVNQHYFSKHSTAAVAVGRVSNIEELLLKCEQNGEKKESVPNVSEEPPDNNMWETHDEPYEETNAEDEGAPDNDDDSRSDSSEDQVRSSKTVIQEQPKKEEERRGRVHPPRNYKAQEEDSESDSNPRDTDEFERGSSSDQEESDDDNKDDSDFEPDEADLKKAEKRQKYKKQRESSNEKKNVSSSDEKKPFVRVRYQNEQERLAARTCPICDKTFAKPANKRIHMEGFHERLLVSVCEICGKSFMNKEGLTRHMRMHTNNEVMPKRYKCTFEGCHKAYVNKMNLKGHQQVHKEVKDHVCKICGSSFTLKYSLSSHMEYAHSETPQIFECTICCRVFKTKPNLLAHMRRGAHSGQGRVRGSRKPPKYKKPTKPRVRKSKKKKKEEEQVEEEEASSYVMPSYPPMASLVPSSYPMQIEYSSAGGVHYPQWTTH